MSSAGAVVAIRCGCGVLGTTIPLTVVTIGANNGVLGVVCVSGIAIGLTASDPSDGVRVINEPLGVDYNNHIITPSHC